MKTKFLFFYFNGCLHAAFGLFLFGTTILTSCNNQQSTSSSTEKVAIKTLLVNKAIDTNKSVSTALDTTIRGKQKTLVVGKPEFDIKKEYCFLNSFLKKYEQPSQFITISTNKPTQVKGEKGIIIYINPTDLESRDGHTIGKNIEIELKELLDQKQLLKANAQTVSDGELLESAGAYYINLTSNNQPLKLKIGKTLEVKLPRYSDNEMSLFYGKRDDIEQMNWQKSDSLKQSKKGIKYDLVFTYFSEDQTNKFIGPTTDTIPDDEYIARLRKKMNLPEKGCHYKVFPDISGLEKYYEIVKLKNLGWINCDRFTNVKDKTTLALLYKEKDRESSAMAFVVFKSYNSILKEFWNLKYDFTEIKNIPVGAQAKVIVIEYKNGKKYSFVKDIIIKAGESTQIAFKEATDEDISKLFNEI